MKRKSVSKAKGKPAATHITLLSEILGDQPKYRKAVLSHIGKEIETLRIWTRPSEENAAPDSIFLAHRRSDGELLSYKNVSENELLELLGNDYAEIVAEMFVPIEPDELASQIHKLSLNVSGIENLSASTGSLSLRLSGIIVPERKIAEGVLINSTSLVWARIVKELNADWSKAYQIPPDKWEEIVAGAYSKAGFDEVILTPRSGDHGRDVIALRKGIGCAKIIGSVKANGPGSLVDYDDVRALLGVLSGERDASKGIITTTSDFPPRIMSDPFIVPFVPYRLELMNGQKLQQWLKTLAAKRS